MTHIYELDGGQMKEPDQAHAYLKDILQLPEHYGMNADALFDCLTADSREILIFLNASDQIHPKILKVFEDAPLENPFLTVIEIDVDE